MRQGCFFHVNSTRCGSDDYQNGRIGLRQDLQDDSLSELVVVGYQREPSDVLRNG